MTTADISTLGVRPVESLPVPRGEIKNQQEVNWYVMDAVDANATRIDAVEEGEITLPENLATTDDITAAIDGLASEIYVDSQDASLQNQIDLLEVQKGEAATYTCGSVGDAGFIPRPGQIGFEEAQASSCDFLQIALADNQENLTKSIQTGDIIEIIGPEGVDTRFKCTDNTNAPLLIPAEFVSGDQLFVTDQEYTIFIYPQNETGATKEYVDAQDALTLQGAIDASVTQEYVDAQDASTLSISKQYTDEAVAAIEFPDGADLSKYAETTYVDAQDNTKIGNTGDQILASSNWKIRAPNSDPDVSGNLVLH